MGPVTYIKHLTSGSRLPFTAAYFISIGLTIYFATGVGFFYPSKLFYLFPFLDVPLLASQWANHGGRTGRLAIGPAATLQTNSSMLCDPRKSSISIQTHQAHQPPFALTHNPFFAYVIEYPDIPIPPYFAFLHLTALSLACTSHLSQPLTRSYDL